MTSQEPPKKKVKTKFFTSYFVPIVAINQSNIVDKDIAPTSTLFVNVPSSVNKVERDPGKRIKISEWPLELRDEVRRKYLV